VEDVRRAGGNHVAAPPDDDDPARLHQAPDRVHDVGDQCPGRRAQAEQVGGALLQTRAPVLRDERRQLGRQVVLLEDLLDQPMVEDRPLGRALGLQLLQAFRESLGDLLPAAAGFSGDGDGRPWHVGGDRW
jgi:hypothetical protein